MKKTAIAIAVALAGFATVAQADKANDQRNKIIFQKQPLKYYMIPSEAVFLVIFCCIYTIFACKLPLPQILPV